jgi:hypothetical protein
MDMSCTMTADLEPDPGPGGAARMPLWLAAGVQDDLLVASNDLERLQRLLTSACDDLSKCFFAALSEVHALGLPSERMSVLNHALDGAVTALQFQDMASQLLAHTDARLRASASLIAREALAGDEDGEALAPAAPVRPNPVTQDEVDAGSIELF